MTVQKLIDALQKYPSTTQVRIVPPGSVSGFVKIEKVSTSRINKNEKRYKFAKMEMFSSDETERIVILE